MKKPFHLATPEEIDALVASATLQAAQESLRLGLPVTGIGPDGVLTTVGGAADHDQQNPTKDAQNAP
jgi:hypothetical protein